MDYRCGFYYFWCAFHCFWNSGYFEGFSLNEREFIKTICERVKDDKLIMDYYNSNLTDRPLENTVDTLVFSTEKGFLTKEQAIVVALFVGMSSFDD